MMLGVRLRKDSTSGNKKSVLLVSSADCEGRHAQKSEAAKVHLRG